MTEPVADAARGLLDGHIVLCGRSPSVAISRPLMCCNRLSRVESDLTTAESARPCGGADSFVASGGSRDM